MNYFSIRDIERMSGIKAHTLRIWEQRYGLHFCKRKESKHRYFDNEDLKEILSVANLYHQGYKISKIATLSKEDICQLAYKNSGDEIFPSFVDQMISASMDYDEPYFQKVIDKAIRQFGFEKTVLNILYPFLEKIGMLWLTGHVIPAQEHFSSFLIQKKLLTAIHACEKPGSQNKELVLVFAPENEFHELPLLILWYCLKIKGIKTLYAGANVSMDTINYYCSHKNVTHLCCNLITNFLQFEPGEYINYFQQRFPTRKLIISGPGFQHCSVSSNNAVILKSLEDVWGIGKTVLGS